MRKLFLLFSIFLSLGVRAEQQCIDYSGRYELVPGTEYTDDDYDNEAANPPVSFGCSSLELVQVSCEEVLLKKCWGADHSLRYSSNGTSIESKNEERLLWAFLVNFHLYFTSYPQTIALNMERRTEFLGRFAHRYTYSAEFRRLP